MSYLGEAEDFRGQTISKPPGRTNAVRQVSSYLGEAEDFAKQNQQSLFGGNRNNQQSNDNNTGIQAFEQTQQSGSGGGSGSNIAQQVLGDTYSQAIALGYNPSELINMVNTAQGFDRGIDLDKFKTDLKRFKDFQEGGTGTQIDGQTFLNVSRPVLSANEPEGVLGLLGAMFSPFADMAGAGADFILGGGTTGKILEGIKNQFNQGKDFVGEMINPGDITQRLNAAGPEARRKYALFLSQGDPYQVAFQKATGQAFARGGVANL
mgnify:CR=1 FL=1|tara:strand:+ start:498 stop:1289 length:792 start_codon:yes stop_codon:yes gene_type:complete